ncbi:MAG TPA: hypothetical protein VGB85_19440, partial [Nannocystis sp.]
MNSRRKRLEREIDRDARVTTSGYVHEVMTVTLGRLQQVSLASQCADPVALFDEVDAITRKFRSFHRRLNDGRINRRGERDRHTPPPAELPAEVRPFAYHGDYLGAFASVEAFAHACLDPSRPDQWADYVDLTQAGIDLHLSGRYWTVDANGVTHAFAVGTPGPGGPDGPEGGPGDGEGEPAPSAPPTGPQVSSGAVTSSLPLHGRLLSLPGPRRVAGQPPLPRHEPERARAALVAAGCDEQTIAELMACYVAAYTTLGAHAWYWLRRGGVPARVLGHTDLEALAADWCASGTLAWASDAEG